MVECAAIFAAVARLGERHGRDATEIVAALKAEADFRASATDQAKAEGRDDIPAGLRAEMDAKWDDRVSSLLHLGETSDWIGYCRALGRERGILP
jgi:adenylosuccinate lyase